MNDMNEMRVPTSSQADLLSLYERLVILATDADRAGLDVASEQLLHLAFQVRDQPASLRAYAIRANSQFSAELTGTTIRRR
jgi:hypothetical protein